MAKLQPLVTGYLERISVKAFEKYHREITDLVQSEHGVYALYKNDRLYYVGLAVDLRRRIKRHLKDKHAGRWNRFSLYLVRRVEQIKEIESLLLRIADPTGNKQAGGLRRATNLEQRLRRLMEQRQRAELEEIFKGEDHTRRAMKKSRRKGVVNRRKVAAKPKAQRPLRGIVGGKRIYATYRGRDYTAIVRRNGGIKLGGCMYDTPSGAALAIVKKPVNGWFFWRVRQAGVLVKLGDVRKQRNQ